MWDWFNNDFWWFSKMIEARVESKARILKLNWNGGKCKWAFETQTTNLRPRSQVYFLPASHINNFVYISPLRKYFIHGISGVHAKEER